MSKRYSNKGYNARNAAALQPKKDNSTLIITLITVGIGLAIVAAVVLAIMYASGAFATKVDMEEVKSEINSFEVTDFAETADVTDYVKITVKDYGEIVIRLRPDVAPDSVENFQNLVKNGHYTGKTFHRIIQNFMIQGGAYDLAGAQKDTATVKGEFASNGFVNNLLHVRGVISMARQNGKPDSGSCQFFICDATSSHLDGEYASFGYVLAGMDTVDKIAAVKTNDDDTPTTSIQIEKVTFVDPLK